CSGFPMALTTTFESELRRVRFCSSEKATVVSSFSNGISNIYIQDARPSSWEKRCVRLACWCTMLEKVTKGGLTCLGRSLPAKCHRRGWWIWGDDTAALPN